MNQKAASAFRFLTFNSDLSVRNWNMVRCRKKLSSAEKLRPLKRVYQINISIGNEQTK